MSQKNETPSADKWRELAEKEELQAEEQAVSPAENAVDDEHLLNDESTANALRDKVDLLEKQVELYKDQAARARAELENNHRRMEQEVSKARKFGAERLLSELIPVVDSLIRGMQGAVSEDPHVKSMCHGMELTLDILHKMLEKNGVVSIAPKVGDTFDPTQHEAMSMRTDANAKPNTILEVLQTGYALHGRVIRAAMVIVSA